MLVFILLCTLLIPLTMVGFGLVCQKHPPKDINGVYGYRTMRSMQNQETWDFAHQVCGRVWRKVGLILLIATFIMNFILYFMKNSISMDIEFCLSIEIFVQTFILLLSIIPVEKALKNNFDDKGNRIEK